MADEDHHLLLQPGGLVQGIAGTGCMYDVLMIGSPDGLGLWLESHDEGVLRLIDESSLGVVLASMSFGIGFNQQRVCCVLLPSGVFWTFIDKPRRWVEARQT